MKKIIHQKVSWWTKTRCGKWPQVFLWGKNWIHLWKRVTCKDCLRMKGVS